MSFYFTVIRKNALTDFTQSLTQILTRAFRILFKNNMLRIVRFTSVGSSPAVRTTNLLKLLNKVPARQDKRTVSRSPSHNGNRHAPSAWLTLPLPPHHPTRPSPPAGPHGNLPFSPDQQQTGCTRTRSRALCQNRRVLQ